MQVLNRYIAAVFLLCLFAVQGVLAEKAPPIRVGVTVSESGDYAALGKAQLEGMQMWADDVNARGALLGRKVEIVHYDDESNPERSAALYERLITDDQVDLLLGPYSSDVTLAASEVAERHSFPMVATGAASTKIWSRGFDNIFQTDAPAGEYMDLPLQFAKDKGLTRVALVYADTDFPHQVADGVRAKAAEYGMQIVFDTAYPNGSTEFAGIVSRIKRTNPEVVIGGTYFDDSIALVRAARTAGLKPKMMVLTVGPAAREFGTALGEDAHGVMGVVAWMRSGKLPMAYDFSFRYKEKFGHNASVHAAYGYCGGQVLEAAVRLAASLDKDKVREQLQNMIFTSILGGYRVDDSGKQLAKTTFAMQWQDGYRLLVLPKKNADAPVLYPLP